MKVFSKKTLLILFAAVFSIGFAFAQTEATQLVFPKKMFVGDTAELQYIFRSNVDFFEKNPELEEKNLDFTKLPVSSSEEITVKKAVIQRNGPMYKIVITFIPWRPGRIDFKEFDLLAAVTGTKSSIPFPIQFNSIEIASVLTKGEDAVLRPIAAPLLAPGTIYFIYGGIIFLVLLVILAIVLFAQRHKIALNIRMHQTLRMYARNARKALRQIRKLEKNSDKLNDEAFCHAIQQIFRVYLSERFGVNFSTLATGQFVKAFNEATSSFMNDEKLEQMEILISIFMRSDYIRFAHCGGLGRNERMELTSKARTVISTFEKQEKINKKPDTQEQINQVIQAAQSQEEKK